MDTQEKLNFTNQFGTITNSRIILNYSSGNEEILINQITSIVFEYKRNYFYIIGSFIMFGILLAFMLGDAGSLNWIALLIMLIFLFLFILIGIAHWIGHHNIVISVSGQNRKPLKVEFSKTKEGRQFVDAIKKVIF